MNTVSPMETAAPLEMPHGRGTRLLVGLFPRQARGLVLQLREDWRTHYLDWTQPGFRAIVAHRLGTWLQAESGRGFVRGPFKWFLRRMQLSMFRYVRNQYGIELPATAIVGRRVLIGHQSGIVIHHSAVIGDDCVIRQNVTIGALNGERDESPVIGKRVELGAGATIIGPVTIGDGARIGPHCVVMTDVPAGATVFVNPPRMIALRSVTPATGAAAAPVRSPQAAGAAR